ncbi:uncharacterized protein LOC129731571 [Wyeomyia smithii]|uniref:uncharacterized protein LOC129731571 n=1 Tax=Wyeomyia smithii TaxID=174621 RepID=UPI00246805C9|nr:uncharacterized protein LOC129731571 [Wyeomyia smithii]
MTDPAAEHEDFSKMYQEEDESAVKFHARLTEKVLLCRYSPADQDRFVRNQLLRGLRNQELKKAARTYNHDSNTIVQAATRAEAFQAEITIPREEPSTLLASSSSSFRGTEGQHKRGLVAQPTTSNPAKRFQPYKMSAYQPRGSVSRRYRCSRCFRPSHAGRECPALRKNCNSCGQREHFAAACRVDKVRTVKEDIAESAVDENREQHVNTLPLHDVQIDCRIGSSAPIRFLIDSGANVNVVGGADWIKLSKDCEMGKATLVQNKIPQSNSLRSYASNIPMLVECRFRATVEAVGLTKPIVSADFLVVKEGKKSLLGRATASDMGLLKVGKMVNACEESCIFPKMPGVKIKFSVDDTVPPVRNAYYNIPAAYRDGARRRLEQMEARGIIERVTTAPQWISGMSAVPKGKGDFRLVVNMRAPNKAIKREYFRSPIIDEMKVKLHGAKYFTKLDLSDAFYHLELSEDSRVLTTFITENGMYRFTRLMFGVNCAPEIF